MKILKYKYKVLLIALNWFLTWVAFKFLFVFQDFLKVLKHQNGTNYTIIVLTVWSHSIERLCNKNFIEISIEYEDTQSYTLKKTKFFVKNIECSVKIAKQLS